MKTCPDCKIAKPLEAFSRQNKGADGRYPYCKECTSLRHRLAYAARGKASWMQDSTCVRCKRLLAKTAYRLQADGKRHPKCPDCEAEVAAQQAKGLRECNSCRAWLTAEAFHPSKLKNKYVTCKECIKQQFKKYAHTIRDGRLRREFGITLAQYKELLDRQNHTCPVCLEKFEPGNFSYPLDHAHSGPMRGRIRAIVHDNCNRFVLWRHDDPAQLRRAADLIENPLTEWLVPEEILTRPKRNRKDAD